MSRYKDRQLRKDSWMTLIKKLEYRETQPLKLFVFTIRRPDKKIVRVARASFDSLETIRKKAPRVTIAYPENIVRGCAGRWWFDSDRERFIGLYTTDLALITQMLTHSSKRLQHYGLLLEQINKV